MAEPLHIGISLGALRHFNDGLGEFSQRLCAELAARAPQLRAERGWQLHLHLPAAFHGRFGDAVGYLGTHTSQRLLHLRRTRFALWHTLHQHIRLQAPLGTTHRLETVHDLNFLHLKQGAKQARYLRRMRARMARRDAVVAISGYVAGELRQALAPRTLPMRVFHGATDLTGVRQEPIEAIAALQAADPQRGFLLHISRLAPSKNIAALLELAAAWPEQPIVLAGAASSYTDAVRQQIAARGLQQVRLQLDLTEGQKAWAYAHCRGFLFPSLAEGFGAPPVEAMHFGKPVFLSRLTSLPEVGGEPAFFFDRFDDGAHLRAVVQAGLAAAAAPGYAERARAQARRHSWTACADAYLALYADLLAGRPV